ncbi:MAG: hypothetical protein U0T84_06150 [Chitinophagales bacterium]
MKKLMMLGCVVGLVALAACTEKMLLGDVEGTWKVAKYTVDEKDQSQYFDTTFKLFRWTFNSGNRFEKTWQYKTIDTLLNISKIFDSVTVANDTVYHFDTVKVPTPRFKNADVKGDWYLINSNKFLQTRDSVYGTNAYKIEAHSSKELQLSRGSEKFFLQAQ